ncbi:ABC transporter substrate-binding protein [Kytococcus sedentarius]|uniref:ABC transporter substrate-binding protein n=1 Tax=Kytococcus sedentarius TaxID=1276 RepID=UPI00194FB0C5|nr:ABC transporter substrate-binding protein [Kytococcus sedentarius]QRO87229.1 ABC transporter substrate-binding protein [Kytococcus sedentarius]
MRPTRSLAALAAVSALTLAACGGDPTQDPAASESGEAGKVTIGSANFTESTVLAEIYATALEDAGVEVEKKLEIGSRETYLPALEDGSIDLIPEYTGTLAAYFDPEVEVTAAEEVYSALQESLPEGLEVLEYSEAENADNVVVTRGTADEQGLEKISDLEGKAGDMTLGGPPEWKERAQGVPGLKEVYGLEFAQFRELSAGGNVTAQALENGQVDAANIFTTDPAIAENDFVILEDDKDLFSAQNVVPLISSDVVDDSVSEALNKVSSELTVEELTQMLVDVNGGSTPEEVASTWAEENL